MKESVKQKAKLKKFNQWKNLLYQELAESRRRNEYFASKRGVDGKIKRSNFVKGKYK